MGQLYDTLANPKYFRSRKRLIALDSMSNRTVTGSIRENLKSVVLRYLPDQLLFSLKKRHYRTVLYSFDESEEPDLAAVKRLVKPGDTVFDIGANIGVYTRFLSSYVGTSGRVESFEPIPPTYRFLSSNIDSLGLQNVRAHCLALCDRKGSQTMLVPQYGDGGGTNFYQASLIRSDESSGDSLRFEVTTDTLDNFWRGNHSKVSFIKIDVEGAEFTLLSNASELLESERPALLVEISGELASDDSSSGKVRRLLEQKGYLPFFCVDGRLDPWHSGARSLNYFFLTERQFEASRAD